MTTQRIVEESGLNYTESVLMLSHVLGIDKAQVIAHPETEVSGEVKLRCLSLLARVSAGEPLAYALGVKEFYGRDFKVNQDVLIPRPETEEIVDIACKIVRNRSNGKFAIAEVGTGSGALIITIAKELGLQNADINLMLVATDISPQALVVAQENAKVHGVDDIEWRCGSMFEPFRGGERFDLIVANLPYLPSIEAKVNKYEPQTALDGGVKGDELINELLSQAGDFLTTDGALIYEGYGGIVKTIPRVELNAITK